MNANSDREYIDNKVGDVRTAVDDLRVTMSERFQATNLALSDLRVTMDARFNAVDAKIDSAVAKGVSEVIKWVVGLFITLIVLVVGLSSVAMNLVLRQPAPVASTPAVIIQLSPAGATITPAAPAGGKP